MSKSIRRQIKENRFGNQPIKRKPWSEPENKKLGKMYKDGVGLSEISIKLNRTENAVFQHIKKLGLNPPKVTSKHGSPEQRKQQIELIKRKEQ